MDSIIALHLVAVGSNPGVDRTHLVVASCKLVLQKDVFTSRAGKEVSYPCNPATKLTML